MCGTKIIYNSVSNIINSELLNILNKEDTREITFMVLTLTEDETNIIESSDPDVQINLINDGKYTSKDVVLFAIKKSIFTFPAISDKFKDDKDVVLFAVNHRGYYLNYVSDDLKDDIDVVLVAVKKKGWS